MRCDGLIGGEAKDRYSLPREEAGRIPYGGLALFSLDSLPLVRARVVKG